MLEQKKPEMLGLRTTSNRRMDDYNGHVPGERVARAGLSLYIYIHTYIYIYASGRRGEGTLPNY